MRLLGSGPLSSNWWSFKTVMGFVGKPRKSASFLGLSCNFCSKINLKQ